jgi:hypothetical protein
MIIVTNDEPVKNLSEFFTKLTLKTTSIKDSIESPPYTFWFRGQGDSTWSLIPKLFRKLKQSINSNDKQNGDLFDVSSFADYEENIDFEFFSTATSFLNQNNIASTRWNRYYLKQHYGIHTRLLDWTQNIMVALYFALSDDTAKDKNARIWILSPFHLNAGTLSHIYNKIVTKPIIFNFCEDEFEKDGAIINQDGSLNNERLSYKYMFLDDIRDLEVFYPLAIKPTLLDQRMSSQQACFTVFSNKINGISQNDFHPRAVDFIDIDKDHKDEMLQQLSEIGFSQYFVYPDLDGLCQAINTKHEFSLNRIQKSININQDKTRNQK